MLGYCRSLGGQAAQPNVNLANLKRFKINLPDLPTQQRIASILSAYDDLIENNRRRIALLEQAARLLYREWFVHLRFPGHETVKVVNGLPEGWQTHLLGQVADFHLGKMLDQNKNKGDSLPYLANVNVRWGEFELSDLREMRFEERDLERFGLRNGDIVMCEGGEPGRCAIWRDQLPRMMFQKALHRIRPLNGMNSEYLYRTLSYQAKRGHLSGLFTGSTIKHLPKEKLGLVTIVVSSQELLDDFERIVTPMSQQAAELAKQNAKLARARDLLLPRLMDGRVPV
jgi:type I restriction enzyme S subunit